MKGHWGEFIHRKSKKPVSYLTSKNFFVLSAILYFLISAWQSFWGWKSPDCHWNVSIASHFFTLNPYSFYRGVPVAPPLGLGFCCTPLLLFYLGPLTYLGNWLGWTTDFIARIYSLPLNLADILNVWLIIKLIRKYRPKIATADLNLIILILFFSGYFLIASGFEGHPETLVLLFCLLGINFLLKKNILPAGAVFGLALSSKQSAVFIILPLFLYLLLAKNGLKTAFKFMLGLTAVFALILSPFIIFHPQETLYGIFGVFRRLIIYGPNLWWLAGSVGRKLLGIDLNPVFIEVANPVLLVVTAAFSLIFLKKKELSFKNGRIFSLVAATLVLSTILSKWVSFHHFLLSFVFVIIFDSVRRKSGFPVFGVAYSLLLTAASYISFPWWQLTVLLINLGAFGYIYRDLSVKG